MQRMQQIFITTAGQINHPIAAPRRAARSAGLRGRVRLGLFGLGIAAGFLPLVGCESFPWDQKPQSAVEEAGLPGAPSVTRGRPSTPLPATKSKTKPKAKKPANPPATATPSTTIAGPAIAAEPGQPAGAGNEGATSESGATTTGPADGPGDAPSSDQIANLPNGQNGNQSPEANQPLDQNGHSGANRPSDMLGRDENGIRALIGEPTKTRTEGSTTVWSYQKDGCALDLFLFYDVKTGAQRVLSYEIKPNATDSNAIQACYDKFHNV